MKGGYKVIVADEEDGRTAPTKNFHHTRENSRKNVNVWKTSTLTLAILLMLYVMEIIKIRKPYGMSPGSNPLGTEVELKHQNTHSALVALPVSTSNNAIINVSVNENENVENEIDFIQKETNLSEDYFTGENTANNREDIGSKERQKEKVESVESVVLPEMPEHNVSFTDKMTNRHVYKRRRQPMSEEDKKSTIEKWGSWTLLDNKERPTEDYYAAYPNRDIPCSDFPTNAW